MEQQVKVEKLTRMKFIATGLLIFMAVVYFIFKRFNSDNFFIGCILAFSEASMVGALADWFAVTALFRHPMGMKWIPHTAIIQNNKDRLGDSLGNFVMTNFFTEEIISSKLSKVDITASILEYVEKNKEEITNKIVIYLPNIAASFLNEDQIKNRTYPIIKEQVRKVDFYPFAKNVLQTFFEDKHHIPLVKQLLDSMYLWVSENKEQTMKMIEGMNKTLSLPFIGEIVYKFIVRSLDRLIEDIDGEPIMEVNKQLLIDMPQKFLSKLSSDTDDENSLKEMVDKLQRDVIESEKFDSFMIEKILELRDAAIGYCINSKDELSIKMLELINEIINYLSTNETFATEINAYIKRVLVSTINSYRNEIGNIISDTVNEWPAEDMIEKLEIEVGGDLQYIRINGTIIGGLVGLLIYLISYFL